MRSRLSDVSNRRVCARGSCHARGTNSFLRHFPNYLCVYLPLVTVLVSCPILVRLSLSRIRARIANTSNR